MGPLIMRSIVNSAIIGLLTVSGAQSTQAEVAIERSLGQAKISQIISAAAADLIVIDRGYEAGFRQGMVCQVSRADQVLGEIILVDLRSSTASSLILSLAPVRSLQVGDNVSVKTISTRK